MSNSNNNSNNNNNNNNNNNMNMTVHMAAQAAAGYIPPTTSSSSSATATTAATTAAASTASIAIATVPSSPMTSSSMSNAMPSSALSSSSSASASAAAIPSSALPSSIASSSIASLSASSSALPIALLSSSALPIASASTLSTSIPPTIMKKKECIWIWQIDKIRVFVQKSNLFPSKDNYNFSNSSNGNNGNNSNNSKGSSMEKYQQDLEIANTLLSNICLALQSASVDQSSTSNEFKKMKTESSSNTSNINTNINNTSNNNKKRDMYHILDSSFSQGADIVHEPGAILSRLTIGGYINLLAGHIGGIADVTATEPILLSDSDTSTSTNINTNTNTTTTTKTTHTITTKTTPIPTAANQTFQTLQTKALNLSHNIQAQLEMDMMESTPTRIINLLCPELTLSQISSIRHRVVETVVHGRGTNSSNFLYSLEEDNDIPTMAKNSSSRQTHEINKFKKCKVCHNNDQGGNGFVLDKKNGDVICMQCGTVISESLMHEGSMYRKFEGEEDRNHHGDVSNPLYSNAYNMATSLSGISMSVGAGMGGYGSSANGGGGAGGGAGGGNSARNIETILKRVHNYTEMNISQMGKEEKKTRIGYKDRQKKEAFVQMNHVGDALSLHQAVLQRAKELFSGFRDDRELLQQFKGVIAACLCEAFDQLSNEGKQILKLQASGGSNGNGNGDGGTDDDDNGNGGGGGGKDTTTNGSNKGNDTSSSFAFKKEKSKRANRRNELHSSNLAGKGGLLLNIPQKRKIDANHGTSTEDNNNNGGGGGGKRRTPRTPTTSALEEKSVTLWDLDDARTWLLEASRIISRKWFEQQDDAGKISSSATTTTTSSNMSSKGGIADDIPKGTIDEMEGRLVMHTLKLCNVLEQDMKKSVTKIQGSGSKRRVVTPRVNEMGLLGIKWQHKHERGSGGAGGVGFSGRGMKGIKGMKVGVGKGSTAGGAGSTAAGGAGAGGKTVGQILRMKTGPQLKKAIGDNIAGEAIYKEFRALLGRQNAKTKQERSEEASMRRMNQMQRKPELQARVMM